ncbi:hypothetical protein SAMN05192551_103135 [Tindallia magadiensis]|uniref:Uncharacterized protein n=1 Tax=Tindallia magadiensis TaxID=69895 RepID=A0A1I3D3L7_9FIRM|nr:hypothetical protein [Tindallia magadiensis]SFH81287.1 hypothetical protein SAMN05192551_103135 [Tindallia magadiensis]
MKSNDTVLVKIDDEQTKTRLIEPFLDSAKCAKDKICLWHQEEMKKKLIDKKYISVTEEGVFPEQIQMALINLEEFGDFEEYLSESKKKHKGSSVRHAKKSSREGYYCKPFNYSLFIPDIVEINHSKEIRCGRKMSDSYRRSIDELGGAPQNFFEFQWPKCPVHYDLWWGVFEERKGYEQGEVITGEKLLAYIRLRRNGNYALYGQILGHGDYLNKGIMYYLHFHIMEWLLTSKSSHAMDIQYLCYAGYNQGGDGLKLWKKKTLFTPAYLTIEKKNIMMQES